MFLGGFAEVARTSLPFTRLLHICHTQASAQRWIAPKTHILRGTACCSICASCVPTLSQMSLSFCLSAKQCQIISPHHADQMSQIKSLVFVTDWLKLVKSCLSCGWTAKNCTRYLLNWWGFQNPDLSWFNRTGLSKFFFPLDCFFSTPKHPTQLCYIIGRNFPWKI